MTLLGYEGQLFGRQYTETVEDARGAHCGAALRS